MIILNLNKLLLLRMEYPAEYRRILLTELHDIIYLLALPSFPLGRPGYFFPTKTSPEVISLWNQLLLKGKLSRPTPRTKQPQLYTTGTSAGARGFSPECSQLLLGHGSPLIMQITARLAVLFQQE
ncbi:hypothetical protein Pelo_14513 [Pelomyxa schiedti]|nr:hypothetical protein Pelo_14513 [Pelomyxa schiedti]